MAPRRRASNVLLIGFMGSGKSTVAKVLARRLSWRVLDLDALVARRAGRSVADIFARDGEAAFRRHEHRALRRASRLHHRVVAVGGGAPTLSANRIWFRRAGFAVWLRVPPDVLARRLARPADAGAPGSRPLLRAAAGDPKALRRLIAGLLRRRRASYRRVADASVPAGSGSPSAVAGRVLRSGAVRGWLRDL